MNMRALSSRAALPVAVLSIGCLLFACNGNKANQESTDVGQELKVDTANPAEAATSATDEFLQTLPSPTHLARTFSRSGLKYVGGLTAPTTDVGKYQAAQSKALNLGVLSADLAYSVFNNQSQEALTYFKAVRTLGDGLQMNAIFENTSILPRVEKNLGNKDSLVYLMSELSMESDILLKQASRMDVVYLSLVGGFVESMYLATSLVPQNNNLEVYNRISDQQTALSKLIAVLKEAQEKDEYAATLTGLQDIETKLEKLNAAKAGVQSTDFNELAASIKAFRDKIIKEV